MTIRLYIKEPTGSAGPIGTLTEEQLEILADLLEEENEGDHDYYIDRDLLDYLEEEGGDAGLVALLKPHVPEADGIEVEWRRE